MNKTVLGRVVSWFFKNSIKFVLQLYGNVSNLIDCWADPGPLPKKLSVQIIEIVLT